MNLTVSGKLHDFTVYGDTEKIKVNYLLNS